MDGMNNRNMVKIGHDLNHFKGGYTALELDFIYAFISCIRNEDKEFTEYAITLQDLEKKLAKRLRLKEIEYIFDSLTSKSFKVNNDEELVVYPFFQKFRYGKQDKIISVKFNEELKPHLLQLQTYALGNLRYILQFRGEYTKRIYMLLSQWQKAREVTYALDDLREMLNVPESYMYGNVKQKVLIKAQTELKKKAPFYFEFEEIKTRQKITSVRFRLIANNIELTAFKDFIREEHFDKRLYEIDMRIIHCSEDGILYWKDKEADKHYLDGDYAEKCWKVLLSKRRVLGINTPSLFRGVEDEIDN